MNAADLTERLTVTVPQAGELLGIGRDAAYAAVGRGDIPVLRVGRRLLVPVPRLLALVGATPDMSGAGASTPATATTAPTTEDTRARDTYHGTTPRSLRAVP